MKPWLAGQHPATAAGAPGDDLPRDGQPEEQRITGRRRSGVQDPGSHLLLVMLIDDARTFRDGRACLAARSSAAGVKLLRALRASAQPIELWLDHDLIGEDRIWPVVRLLEDEALAGRRWDIVTIKIHASSAGRAHEMAISLRRAGYDVERVVDPRVFIHRSPDVSSAVAFLAGEDIAESLD